MSRPQSATRSAPAYQQGAPARMNAMAVWSLVLSIINLAGLGSLAGIALGAAARRRIAVTGERGRGVAVAGIVVGVVTLLLAIAYWIYVGMHFGISSGPGGGGGGGGY